MRVLRLCSVFEPGDAAVVRRARFDPIGGMQNHTANLTRELDRRGVHQTVVTSRLGGRTGRQRFGASAEIVRVGLPIRRLRQAWAPLALPHALGAAPDLVHAHQGEDLAVLPLAVLAARRFACPLVVTLHTSLHTSPSATARMRLLRLFGAPLESSVVRRADGVIVLTGRAARAWNLPAVTVIPSGVEDGPYPSEPGDLLADVPGPRILYLGRLAAQKDVPTLVRAFGRLTSPASLCIVGDGPERPAVERAVAALPAAARERVHLSGFEPHDRVPGLLAAADLLVLPSIYEEMGSVLAEAMRAGVPVVASRVGGIPEVVVEGTTGLLVPPGDDAGFAAAIDRLLRDDAERAAMGAAALARAERYRWPELAGQVLEVYRAAEARRCTTASRSAVRSAV
jgi:glycosyltransferase involved in cell wall biosynthesis